MKSYSPVFADPTQRRWVKIRRGLSYAAAIGTILFVILMLSVLLTPFVRRVELSPPKQRVFGKARHHPRRPAAAARLLARAIRSTRAPTAPVGSLGFRDMSQISISGFYVSWDDASLTSLRSHSEAMDRIYPQWLYLEGDAGQVRYRVDRRVKDLGEDDSKLKIVPVVMNYDPAHGRWMDKELNAVLNNAEARSALIERTVKIIVDEDFNGLMVDFEYVAPETRRNYVFFLKALADALHEEHKTFEVSVEFDQPAAIDYAAIGAIADRVILMAYDQNAETTTAGPICGLPWFVERLDQRLRQIPAGKVEVALGNYGYDWTGASRHPRSTGSEEALRLAGQSGATVDFDPTALNPTFQFVDEKNQEHEVWFLDSVTAYNEIQASLARGVSSFAVWRLGIEDPGIWKLRSSNQKSALIDHLETIETGPRLEEEGKGNMVFVKDVARTGRRKVEFDPREPLVTDVEVLDFPKPFTLVRYGQASGKIALTFDDGPDPKYTPQILDILKRYGLHANFFVIGLNAEDERGLVRREYAEGHEVGNHTFTHPNIADVPVRQLELELNSTQRLLESIIGRNCVLFRPPFDVDTDPTTPAEALPIAIASHLGYLTVGSGNDPSDYARPGTDIIVARTLQQLRNSDVILFHDGGGNREQTVRALPTLIEEIQRRGFQIVPLSDLLGKTRDDVMPPLTRNQMYLSWANTLSFGVGQLFILFSRWGLIIGVSLGVLQFVFYSIMAYIHRMRKPEGDAPYLKPVTVIVPAYNEEKVIEYTIKSLLQSEGVDINIIAVDDGSTDGTLAVLRKEFGNHPKVRIVTQPNAGKAAALNHGVRLSSSEIVVTLDSDTIFTHDCLQHLVRPFSDPTVTAVAGNAKVGNRINILTRWQALEYVTTQNFIRRSNSLINCITVVPGAVGAWRRDQLLNVGGYEGDTLAEDGELTIRVLADGGKIVYADNAVAWTEAPQNLRNLFRQRFRWMYGTFQTAWKHRKLAFNTKQKLLGWIAMPNMFMFQVVFPFTAPLMDLVMLFAMVFFFIQRAYHPADFAADQLVRVLFFYSLFLLFDLATAILSIFLEPKREDLSLLIWLPWQRFFYRQLNHIIALRTMFTAARGESVGWGHITRNATHLQYFTESELSESDPVTLHRTIADSETEISKENPGDTAPK